LLQLISHLSTHITLPKGHSSAANPPAAAPMPPPPPSSQEEQRKFTCLTCGKIFSKQEQLSGHLKVHAMERRAQLRQEREEQQHQQQETQAKSQQASPKSHQYKCRFCSKLFDSLGELDVHTKIHSAEYKFRCSHCGEAFSNSSVAQAHQRICSLNHGQEPKPKRRRSDPAHRTRAVTRSQTGDAPQPQHKAETGQEAEEEDEEDSQDGQQGGGYVPDNNSNNVIPPDEIEPPATDEERRAGFCHRKLPDGRRRIVCVDCGKHYTTMYVISSLITIRHELYVY
jgi:DNA-directed RNA polymerase subunit RPC12/RpoP